MMFSTQFESIGKEMLYFTPRARQVLAMAREEADRLNHNFVGTEHLLLGFIKLGQGVAVNALRKMGLVLESVRIEVEKSVGPGFRQNQVGSIPYTSRVKEVLRLAAKEAKDLSHTYVGTEHILLGVLREGDCVCALVFKKLGIELEAARKEVLKELGVTIRPAWSLEEASHLDPSGIANELTPRAQQVLVFAGEEADRLGHVLVGTGHLLIGLIKLGSGVASNVIQELGVEAKAVRAEIERQGESEHAQRPVCDIPCTVGAEKALDLATNEAVNLNHTYVGTEHILLGLLCDRDGVAAGVFEHLGIDIERTRQEILRELGSG